MMTEKETRKKFALYFPALQAEQVREGAGADSVDKETEWENYVSHLITEGDLPPEAANWRCPRSLRDELAN